jgi:hypothetical protein
MSEEQRNPPFELFTSYLAMIENSPGTNMFRHRYYTVWGESLDVLDDGDLSCAVFVTSVLYMFDLIGEIHTKVSESIKDLHASGWFVIKEPRPGAVIQWGFKRKDEGTQGRHNHLGFYLDTETAVSNESLPMGHVISHHPTYGTLDGEPRRSIVAYWWHPALGEI